MKLDLPLTQMTIADKIQAMEILWADLSKTAPDAAVPSWHWDVLAAREARLAAGAERLLSWEEAKATLRSRVDDHKNS